MALPFWLGFAPVLQAQEVDSVLTENAVDTAALLTISDNILKNVRPHRNLKNFKAYLDIMDSDPNTKSYEKMLPPNYSIVGKEERFKGIFKSKKDTYRRFRDLSIFAFGGVYLLSVIDAYVDAELSTFDISHDLSLEIHPTMIETGRFDMHHRTTTPGVQCVINF